MASFTLLLKCTFWKKVLKNLKAIFFPNNFALKIENSWAKKVVKPILENWNATNNVVAYVWFIYSDKKIKHAMWKRIIVNGQNLQ